MTLLHPLSTEVDTCCVVDQFCLSPANLEELVPVRSRCVCCDESVCRMCSTRRLYRGRLSRICNDCQIEYLDNRADARVMARLRRLAR